MKSLILLIFFQMHINLGVCQYSNAISKEYLTLSVECYKEKVIGKENLKFVLAITNVSTHTVDIPSEYILGPIKSIGHDIFYEIYYCEKKDSLDVFDSIYVQIHREFLDPQRVFLNSGNRFLVPININNSSFIFKRKGIYKIRFTLRSSYVKDYLTKDISTEWVFVNLE